jgi:hypothetical protein
MLRHPRRSTLGTAYLIVLGVTGLLMIIVYTLSQTGVASRRLTVRSANDQKAMDLAESATQLTFRLVAEQMNDPQMIYDLISFKRVDGESWFWKFRLPQAMAAGEVDPLQYKNSSISYADTSGNGLGMELSIGPEMLLKLSRKYDNGDLCDLEEMIKDMGGEVEILAEAKIKKTFGILPKCKNYEIPGITFDLTEANTFADFNIGNFLNSLMDDKELKIDLTEMLLKPMPDLNFGSLVKKTLDGIQFNLTLWAVAIPIPAGRLLGALLQGMTTRLLGDSATLKGFLRETLLKNLKLQIDLTDLKRGIRDKILGILPDEVRTLQGKVGWGVTVEKIGIFEVKTTVTYRPQGTYGPAIKKTLQAQRDFRVADIQPIAPDYTFFVANSAKLFENPDQENTAGWKGDDEIKWDEGMGRLVLHNITLFDDALFAQLRDFFNAIGDMNVEKMCNSFFMPGRVRVNGTKPMIVRLNFGLLDFFSGGGSFTDALRGCEIAALLVCNKDKHRHMVLKDNKLENPKDPVHPIIPAVGESIYGTSIEGVPPLGGWVAFFNMLEGMLEQVGEGSEITTKPTSFLQMGFDALKVKHFDWPWVTDGMIWIPIPKFYNRTQFFGDFHVEFPLSFRVEGNLWKRYSRLKMPMIRIFVPLNWLFGAPNVDITLPPIPFNQTIVEPYGFCHYPPAEDDSGKVSLDKMKTLWNPDEAKNLPDNVYSPHQYLKKASYYYDTTADFSKDVPNRSIEMEVDGEMRQVFVCDGVTFVEGKDNQGLFFRNELYVMGRGMIVAAGNIHLKSIRRVDPPDGPPTMLSIIARNGALINSGSNTVIDACLYGDRGLMNPFYGKIRINGNLVVNQFKRSDCQGTIHVHFQSNRTHSSLMSYFKDLAKYDPTRFHVSLSKKWREYQFLKQ